jgi:hypothetical protein
MCGSKFKAGKEAIISRWEGRGYASPKLDADGTRNRGPAAHTLYTQGEREREERERERERGGEERGGERDNREEGGRVWLIGVQLVHSCTLLKK